MGIVLIAQGLYLPYILDSVYQELVEMLTRPAGFGVFFAYVLHSHQDWLRGETLMGRLK